MHLQLIAGNVILKRHAFTLFRLNISNELSGEFDVFLVYLDTIVYLAKLQILAQRHEAFLLSGKLHSHLGLLLAQFGKAYACLYGSSCINHLLGINGKIFIGQGQAIERNAAKDVRILVVGNPCNTNCWIAMTNATKIPANRWFAMTMLDENRAKAQLAEKAGVHNSDVTNMTIWGNHSSTQYPDFYNAKICGKPATDVIKDEEWLKNTFIPTVQKRGAAIIEARGLSSAASAANAAIDTVRNLVTKTPDGDWFSVSVCSDGSYGTPKGIITSLPVRSNGKDWEIVQGLDINEFSKGKIEASNQELLDEQKAVQDIFAHKEKLSQ